MTELALNVTFMSLVRELPTDIFLVCIKSPELEVLVSLGSSLFLLPVLYLSQMQKPKNLFLLYFPFTSKVPDPLPKILKDHRC